MTITLHKEDGLVCPVESHTETIAFENSDIFRSVDSLKELLENRNVYYIFKHSKICPISHTAYKRVVQAIQKELIQDVYLVVVQDQRDISNQIATYFNVTHESPQLLKIDNTKVLEIQNHLDILKGV